MTVENVVATAPSLQVVKQHPQKSNPTLEEELKQRIPQVFDGYQKEDLVEPFVVRWLEGVSREDYEKIDIVNRIKLTHSVEKYTGGRVSRKTIDSIIDKYFEGTLFKNFNPKTIVEKDGHTFVQDRRTTKFLSNFVLEPEYMVTRSSDTNGGGNIHENLYCFQMIVRNNNFDEPQVSKIMLRASDFDSLKVFQEATQKVGGRIVTGTQDTIAEFGVHVLNKPFPTVKYGSNVIGLDIIEGRKYFVTPHAVYDVETGNEVNHVVYMPENDINPVTEYKLGNLKYDPVKWREQIAPFVLRHIMKIQKKDTMLLLAGWLAAIPVEHVFRKMTGELSGFPHAMITGMNGGGKTVLATSLLPYLGYSNDAELLNFGGKVANIQSIDWSYNIIVIFDEYRPNEWSENERKGVERLIRESYGRSEDRKSNTSYNVRKFVRKNPMMMLGQMTTSDDANSERIIQIYLDPNFMNSDSPEAEEAKRHSREFRDYKDKNFWVGFCLWMAKQSEEELLRVYHDFKNEVVELFPDMKDRVRCFCAVVMTGLHFIEKLAEELGVPMEEVGYNASNIMLVPHMIAENRSVTQGETTDILEEFLDDLVTFGMTHGNTKSAVFGKNRLVQVYPTYLKNKHTWGKHDEPANIGNRKKVILVKLDAVINEVNNWMNKHYDEKLLNPVLKSYYDAGLENPNDALVLAPNGYRVNGIRYTVFDCDKLCERGFRKIYELWSEGQA